MFWIIPKSLWTIRRVLLDSKSFTKKPNTKISLITETSKSCSGRIIWPFQNLFSFQRDWIYEFISIRRINSGNLDKTIKDLKPYTLYGVYVQSVSTDMTIEHFQSAIVYKKTHPFRKTYIYRSWLRILIIILYIRSIFTWKYQCFCFILK